MVIRTKSLHISTHFMASKSGAREDSCALVVIVGKSCMVERS